MRVDFVGLGYGVLAVGALVGCSGAEAAVGAEADARVVQSQRSQFKTRVPVGDEVQLCRFIRMPSDPGLSIVSMNHEYTAGSHHFLVFRTEMDEMPAGGDELTPCEEGAAGSAGSSWMSNVRGIVYGTQSEQDSFAFPDGVGMHVEPGELLLVQTHYLNTGGEDIDATIDFELNFGEQSQVEEEAGVLFYFNPSIHVPANARGSASLTCPIHEDINLAFAASHMHKRGVNFRAETDDTTSAVMQGGSLYATTEWSEPLPRIFEPGSSKLSGGSNISYKCDFANDLPAPVVSGASAETNEMCMFVAMYWPRQDQATEWCYDGVTGSAGKAGGAATFDCLAGCRVGGGDACSGGCWDNACPNVPMKLTAMRGCIATCGVQCLGGLESAGCSACASEACPEAYAELTSAVCE